MLEINFIQTKENSSFKQFRVIYRKFMTNVIQAGITDYDSDLTSCIVEISIRIMYGSSNQRLLKAVSR